MSNLKKILKKNFYLECPDNLENIKKELNLVKTDRKFLKLKHENTFLRFACIIVSLLLLFFSSYFIQAKPLSLGNENLTFDQAYIDATFRVKVKEENISTIYGKILPVVGSERADFIKCFSEFNLNRIYLDPDLEGFDSLYYMITFIDGSSFEVTVYANDMVHIKLNNQNFYFYEYQSYNKLI